MMGSLYTASVGERLLLLAGALTVSILAGAFVAKVDFLWVLGVVGVLTAVAVVFSREAILWFVIVTGLVVVGACQMYLGTGYFKYIPPLASAALLLHAVSHWMQHPREPVPATVHILLLFFGLSLLSLAANWQSFGLAVVGLKTYYPMWSLFLGMALIQWRPALIDSLPKAALWIAVLQLPFVLHQFLILVPLRASVPDLVAVDVVAGTFGGDIWGGAANAVLTLFLIMVCSCLLGMWRHDAISGPLAMGGVLLLLTPVLMNSARAALLYLPIVALMIFFSDIARHPLRALAGLLLAGTLVVGMLMSYTALNQDPNTKSWQDLVRNTWEYQLHSEWERGSEQSSLSRWTALTFWAEKRRHYPVMSAVLGHGPGASQPQEGGMDLADTLAETRYGGRQIGYTAISALLWDLGVAGVVVVVALFWAAFRQTRRLLRHYRGRDPAKAGIAHGLSAALVILLLSLAHKDFFVHHVPFQTMLAGILGYLAFQVRRMEQEQHERPAPERVPAPVEYGRAYALIGRDE